MRRFNFSYDKDSDDLFMFRPDSKSKGSVELGDIILDMDKKKEVVGIQLLNASKLLKDITNDAEKATIREILAHLRDCRVDIKTKGNLTIIKISLCSESKEILPILSLPRFFSPSPALAHA